MTVYHILDKKFFKLDKKFCKELTCYFTLAIISVFEITSRKKTLVFMRNEVNKTI
jgi:hypothetical protein